MQAANTASCGCHEPSGGERVRYFPRQLLTADDMRTEQEYFREKQRRHNRLLHGSGVVCGLQVVADPASGPMVVNICPGYAIGPCGDEICVEAPCKLDLTYCARPSASPCTPQSGALIVRDASTNPALVVRIRYAECPTRPMRTLPAGCGCDDTACEYSRIRDGFEIQCVQKPPLTRIPLSAPAAGLAPAAAAAPVAGQPAPGATAGAGGTTTAPVGPAATTGASGTAPAPGGATHRISTGCPPCPDDPWLILAEIQTSASGLAISAGSRQMLSSNVHL